jgi:hypothetical protein
MALQRLQRREGVSEKNSLFLTLLSGKLSRLTLIQVIKYNFASLHILFSLNANIFFLLFFLFLLPRSPPPALFLYSLVQSDVNTAILYKR